MALFPSFAGLSGINSSAEDRGKLSDLLQVFIQDALDVALLKDNL